MTVYTVYLNKIKKLQLSISIYNQIHELLEK